MLNLVWIMVGGALGTGARYGVSRWLNEADTVPVGTLSVNVVGCFMMGLAASFFAKNLAISETVKMAAMVGFLGGFTTFSSYGIETLKLAQGGRVSQALIYLVLSNVLGFLAVWLGASLIDTPS